MFPHLFLSQKVAPEGATLLAAADATACCLVFDELGAVLRFSLSNSRCGVDVARRLARSRPKFRDVLAEALLVLALLVWCAARAARPL